MRWSTSDVDYTNNMQLMPITEVFIDIELTKYVILFRKYRRIRGKYIYIYITALFKFLLPCFSYICTHVYIYTNNLSDNQQSNYRNGYLNQFTTLHTFGVNIVPLNSLLTMIILNFMLVSIYSRCTFVSGCTYNMHGSID